MVRYGPEHKKQTHDRIVADAARLFREKGYQGSGVDGVMAAAGLTAGGFYSHFRNKDALLVEVLSHCFGGGSGLPDPAASNGAASNGAGTLGEWVEAYLSDRHRDAPGAGCPIPTLAAEVARQGPEVRAAFTSVLGERIADLAGLMSAGTADERTDAALGVLAAAAGAMLLARAVDDTELSDRVLRAVRTSIQARANSSPHDR